MALESSKEPVHPTGSTSSLEPAKILVAVHGIGDQVGYETAQAVARQVGHYYDVATSIPLGRFYTGTGANNSAVPMPFLVTTTDNPDLRGRTAFDVGFAEVYWASIPRKIVDDGHILEESKKWAGTVAGRLAQRAQRLGKPMPIREQERVITVLGEMIETIAVVERLNLVLAKAGVFQFNLNKLLTDFLGDVQIVVDFQAYREQILDALSQVMDAALKLGTADQPRELYLIGHSEGSVITFLAVLKALADPASHPWINSVRGIMTIGSPIEVHHLLWPALWQDLKPSPALAAGLTIPWHNYYDYGDPIAYELTATRKWVDSSHFGRTLRLEEFEYAHSYLPGKAHVDYWTDNEVFAHFLDRVVCTPTASASRQPSAAPTSRWPAVVVSYAIPKLIVIALMCLATYVLYRPIANAIVSGHAPDAKYIFFDVAGIALLLLGVTASARLPRLTNSWPWWLAGAAWLAVSMVAYWGLVNTDTQNQIGARLSLIAASPTQAVLTVAGLIALVAGALASWFPSRGTLFLPLTGVLAITALIGQLVWTEHEKGELWPVMLGGTVFFYLWRISALLFDLVFVWHRYVRHAAARHSIAEVCDKGYEPSTVEKWAGPLNATPTAAPARAK